MSEVRIGHMEVESPWGNAGGVVKSLEDLDRMLNTGGGWAEAGSYTLYKKVGNEGEKGEVKVLFIDPATGETGNSLGMPNKGIVGEVEKDIPEMADMAKRRDKGLIINVAPITKEPVSESRELVERVIAAGAPAVLLNAGCPNVITKDGGRHEILSLSPEPFGLVLNGLRDVVEKYDQRIFVRISPQQSYESAETTMQVIRRSGVVSAVFTPNTFPGYKPMRGGEYMLGVPGNSGGKSGPITAPESREQTVWAVKALEGSGIDVVSSCGIFTPEELKLRQSLGAVAGAGTTFYLTEKTVQEGWSDATDRFLRRYLEL